MSDKMMNAKQLKQALRKCKYVFGWVVIHADSDGESCDGSYLQIQKQSVLQMLSQNKDGNFSAVIRDDGDLYLN